MHAWGYRDGDKQSLGKAGSEMARGELQPYIAENQVHRQTMKVGDKGDSLVKIKASIGTPRNILGSRTGPNGIGWGEIVK